MKAHETISPDKIAELRLKHLEMLQNAVARMAAVGVTLKNYCITLTTAVCGFSITLQRPLVALLALLPITTFALLDSQYLRTERRFRALFDQVRSEDWGSFPSFEVNLKNAPLVSYCGVLRSWSIINFYVPLGLAIVLVALITGYLNGKFI
jgi:hypothetical protein